MWLPKSVIDEVNKVARVSYISRNATGTWNKYRREGELRLMTGWAWTSRDGSAHRQGFKTMTVCYRDAYYSLIRAEVAPFLSKPVVVKRAAKQRAA